MKPDRRDHFRRDSAAYYAKRFAEHGACPRGMDWRDQNAQEQRFAQLMRIAEGVTEPFSLLDYGCGYGALRDWLAAGAWPAVYTGYEPSAEIAAEARRRLGAAAAVHDDESALAPSDYVVASGVWNVKFGGADDASWRDYVLADLERLDALSTRGFAFNLLTAYSDADRKRPDLFYADPGFFFDHCMRRFSRRVALLHDYPLYDFTVLVRKG